MSSSGSKDYWTQIITGFAAGLLVMGLNLFPQLPDQIGYFLKQSQILPFAFLCIFLWAITKNMGVSIFVTLVYFIALKFFEFAPSLFVFGNGNQRRKDDPFIFQYER